MSLLWRFYVASDSKWHWEKQLNGTVVAQCGTGQPNHRRCMLDALKHGYQQQSAASEALDRNGKLFARWNR